MREKTCNCVSNGNRKLAIFLDLAIPIMSSRYHSDEKQCCKINENYLSMIPKQT